MAAGVLVGAQTYPEVVEEGGKYYPIANGIECVSRALAPEAGPRPSPPSLASARSLKSHSSRDLLQVNEKAAAAAAPPRAVTTPTRVQAAAAKMPPVSFVEPTEAEARVARLQELGRRATAGGPMSGPVSPERDARPARLSRQSTWTLGNPALRAPRSPSDP